MDIITPLIATPVGWVLMALASVIAWTMLWALPVYIGSRIFAGVWFQKQREYDREQRREIEAAVLKSENVPKNFVL